MKFPKRAFTIIAVTVASNAILWLDSFDRYLSTRYHINITSTLPESWFIPSKLIEVSLIERGQALIRRADDLPAPPVSVQHPTEPELPPKMAQQIAPPSSVSLSVISIDRPPPSQPTNSEPRVLFAGDSMMQGVAPIVISQIKKEYPKATLLDLSKQSTGLTVRRYFDWPTKIKEETTKRDISSVVIFLGPNDPWDITEGKNRYPFPSQEWEDKYRERVIEVLQFADEQQIRVVWIGLPAMKNERVRKGAVIQNRIFREECERFECNFIDTEELLGRLDQPFTKYIPDEKKGQVLVRADDGTHFTPHGLRLIAGKVVAVLGAQTPK